MQKMLQSLFFKNKSIFTAFLICCTFSFHPVLAQSNTAEIDTIVVSIRFDNTSLRDALNQIVTQTNLQITYNDEIVKGIKINKNFDNVTIRTLLDSLITANGLTYKILTENQ